MSQMVLPETRQLEQFQHTGIEAARIGAKILRHYAAEGFDVERKDPDNTINLVTQADKDSERAIVDFIQATFPTHQILAEEEGIHSAQPSPYKCMYNVSIGLEYDGHCIVGVVLDPTRDELFSAVMGQGATLNGQPIQVSSVPQLDQALLVTGFGYDIRENPQNNLEEFRSFALKAQGMRRTGTAAIDLCYVACGRLDGFWELNLNPWDTAAGLVIVQEAGGRVTDYKGNLFSVYQHQLVASNGFIHQEMLGVLRDSV
jgi:myo-inositol-1(or 4)-monophosphatase